MLNVTPNQQPRECGACVTVWAIICSIHPCKVVFFVQLLSSVSIPLCVASASACQWILFLRYHAPFNHCSRQPSRI